MTAPHHNALVSPLITAAHEAGRRIMAHYGTADIERKDDNSPVTAADREADAILVAALQRIAPETPVISEESSPKATIEEGQPFFLVDPLDGTREFINKRQEFTVNVALIEKSIPVFGLVYAPAARTLYVTPSPGRAVRAVLDPDLPAPEVSDLDITEITTRTPTPNALTAAISRSHLDAETEKYLQEHGISDTYVSGSSLKFCCLAEGHADVYPRFGRTMEWDTAAGHAVLSAAGGIVTGTDGSPFIYGKQDEGFANPGFIAWGRDPKRT